MPDNACKLTATPNPSVFKAAAGTIVITITPTKGNVAFVPTYTTVTDGSGNPVAATVTATSLTFDTVAGTLYHIQFLYYIFPLNSTGTLQEKCTGGVVLDDIDQNANPQVYTIQA